MSLNNPVVQTGLENLLHEPPKYILGKRAGLLCNPASVDRSLRHARALISNSLSVELTALYSPQHGFNAEKQDNMIESDDTFDSALNIPVFSLYGKTRIPTKEMFEHIDLLFIDLQDAGTRVYTFMYTMSYCLEAAKKFSKAVILLDRPNPVSGAVMEGNTLKPENISFVGRYPLPMRHGLTIGELALLFNEYFNIGCELEVIPMKGWERDMFFADTGLPWIPPSPNLPTPVSAMVYPGQVLWEGTNISEGRGTTQPFELFGAPFIDTEKVLSFIGGNHLPGVYLRQVFFEPVSNKWMGSRCNGFQIHVTNAELFQPYLTTLKLIQAVACIHKDRFEWAEPPYEYEFDRLPIDLITGDSNIRYIVESDENIETLPDSWGDELRQFDKISRNFHLY
ncbi:MAG: DUF1343 domain-containing protein [Deltaproteobacteria bacterium]|nr:DUF1343 domain-containing protein [Deltaproteobacteria bacterium]